MADRQRRALNHSGGEVRARGARAVADVLADILARADAPLAPEGQPVLTHGFHSYPARMHPGLARAALSAFAPPGERAERSRVAPVLDPFCGSGTVLIEARAQGLPSHGVDLNPLAIRVAAVQGAYRTEVERARFLETLASLAERSEARVRARVKARAPLSAAERAFYEPHVLLELAGLHAEIATVEPKADRRAFEVVLSAMLVKFSRQRSDTATDMAPKRLRKGLVTEFFVRKAQELVERWAALCDAIGAEPARLRLSEGDARELPRILPPGFGAGLVLTSPPYGGTYDYVEHHARRYAWLGLSAERFAQGEIGARRRLSRASDAGSRWDRELGDALVSLGRVTLPDGWLLLWMGDGQVAGRRVPVDEQLERLAPDTGLEWIAAASQVRPDFTGGRPRREHLVALRPRG